jgi:hypothetical protein
MVLRALRRPFLAFFLLVPELAAASPVAVVGGFTGFSGLVGSSTGFETIIDGVSVCPPAGCGTGFGSLSYSFGAPLSAFDFYTALSGVPNTKNELAFTPAPAQDVGVGEEFLLGTFTYSNGIWLTDPEFTFELTSVSSDPALDGFVFSDTLHLSITSNEVTATPQQNADFVWFLGAPRLGSARAYELGDSPTGGNTVSWELYGMISSLDVTEFANATGSGFLYPTVLPIPEPGCATLLLAAAAAAAQRARRRSAGRERGP